MAGSFSGARILNSGAGYVDGDICLKGNTHGGSGFSGAFLTDPLNGSILSVSIIQHGVNYTEDPFLFGLCYPSSKVLQVWLYSLFIGYAALLVQFLFFCRRKQ